MNRDASIRIERARPDDAAAIADVLTRSIAELCAADHGGDAARIAAWTRNKTPAMAARWIADPVGTCLVSRVAERDVAAVGAYVGCVVLLLYVAPSHRFGGHSARLLAYMEAEMRASGLTEARLSATRTALAFYRARGWIVSGPEEAPFGMPATPMTKRLA